MNAAASAMNLLPAEPRENASKAEWAVWNARVGAVTGAFKVFPCRPDGSKDEDGKSTAKLPRAKGWQAAASDDPKTVEAMWSDHPDSNIGLLISPGFVAVDIDTHKEGKADILKQFEKDHGRLPDTLEFCSANGGFHLIYSTTRELGNGTGSLPHGFDVRGGGKGYIVGPGSTFEGKLYTLAELLAPVALPPGVDTCLVTTRPRSSGSRDLPQFVMLDDPVNVDLYARWLRGETVKKIPGAKPGTCGEDGNHRLASAGAMGASLALSEEETVHLLSEHFNPRCEPEWSEQNLCRHGGSGYRTASSDFGNLATPNNNLMFAQKVTRGDPAKGVRAEAGRFAILDPDADDHTPDPEWLIPGLLQCNTDAMLTGRPGVGKSFIALDIGLSVATGSAPGRVWPEIAHSGAVLFAAGEGGAGLKQRRRAWEKTHNAGKKVSRFFRSSGVPLVATEEDIAAFIAAARAANPDGYRLVIIDTANRSMQGQNPNATEIATALTGMSETIRRELAPVDGHGCTVLVLHHPGVGKEAQDRPAGSHAFQGNVDTALVASRVDKADTVTLTMTKQKDAPEWEVPKSILLQDVELSEGEKSLVVMPAKAGEERADRTANEKPRSKHDPRPKPSEDVVITDAAVAVLKSQPNARLNGSQLAQAVKHKGCSALKDDSLRRKLQELACNESNPLHKAYDPTVSSKKGQWCWAGRHGIEEETLVAIDRAVGDVLRDKGRRMNGDELAQNIQHHIAYETNTEISKSDLANKHLVTLRKREGTLASRCYRALDKSWVYVPAEAGHPEREADVAAAAGAAS